MSKFLIASVGLLVAAAVGMGSAPVKADPAYTSGSLVAIFAKDKAALDAAKKRTRKVCFEGDTDPDCGPAATPEPSHVNLRVNFEFNSDNLTASAKENLSQLAAALNDPRLGDSKFAIDGYTDATGTGEYNQDLSERRARAVVSFLAVRGVDPTRLEAKGFGSAKPVAADPYAGVNRRVEAHIAP